LPEASRTPRSESWPFANTLGLKKAMISTVLTGSGFVVE
jgi:hypothetical protein